MVSIKKYLRRLRELGITEAFVVTTENELRNKWGEGRFTPEDLVWSLFSKQAQILIKNQANPHDFSMLYFSWALYAYETDKNPYDLQQQSLLWRIRSYQERDVPKVQILANDCCNFCKKDDKRIFNLSEALTKNSPLPRKQCAHKVHAKSKYPWCVCTYLPYTELSARLTGIG